MASHVAIVTGASRGIGRAIAVRLAAQGHTVIGTATSDAGAVAISEAWSEAGFTGQGRVLDVSDAVAIEGFIKSVTEDFGAPGILVNNAGITRDNLVMRMKDEEWEAIIQTNLSSVFRMSKACLKGMLKARWGRIVSITSVVGSTGNAGQANYAAAKSGVIGFTRSLARELGSRNVTVNTVAPGFIDTDMTRSLPEEHKTALLGNIPLGRLGQADEIAAGVAFLCSDDAAYITGETLHINGGMYTP
ncbi:3-oxoacyl-ACP reductase FabG [Candidatus Methylospira mobilis]|uniref:3-oxoacyl-[acyl-carrier-protein] reductase n=1 Tax=Candidatus Methylospira mobilis TaxID=1808979 RepID=A0A5Q0BIG1_9GAMM|nr:3-oxoacyl-ACP reductase FabG [Candidatus Methylospira mobilis]QFY43613.1 3-oxoacyl-ACP reductase FabG [Candidatus Methylospira mobilis]WNV04603.1 3-oxoacyl-ACP reductase FabG [Candidatus Methylospira mobilis]